MQVCLEAMGCHASAGDRLILSTYNTRIATLPSCVETMLITLFGIVGGWWVRCCVFCWHKKTWMVFCREGPSLAGIEVFSRNFTMITCKAECILGRRREFTGICLTGGERIE